MSWPIILKSPKELSEDQRSFSSLQEAKLQLDDKREAEEECDNLMML